MKIPTFIKVWALTSLLVTGVILLIARNEITDSKNAWVTSLLAAVLLYTWGTIMWNMIERRQKTVSVSVRKFTNEDGKTTLNIDVYNATPEEAVQIYDHIKGLEL